MNELSFAEFVQLYAAPARAIPLDPGFRPAILFAQAYEKRIADMTDSEALVIGVEREDGLVSRYTCRVAAGGMDEVSQRYIERVAKFMLWSRGGWRLFVGGPPAIGEVIQRAYTREGVRAFDVALMERVYERSFEVVVTRPEDVPEDVTAAKKSGGHLNGCRIGFDLGASDFKLAAVQDGEVKYSDEIPWNPKDQPDPDYHYQRLADGLRKAAAYLPRVDAIGGSTAGVVVNNRFMVASIFRSVPADRFHEARELFIRLQREWQVPFQVLNDGEVTALAGAMSLDSGGILGIAMGSSEAVGYVAQDGAIPGWLDELAFAPVDMNPDAPPDEWSGDRGVGALYFSQQAVNKLAPAAGISFDENQPLPERLKVVQQLMEQDDPRAQQLYRTIGLYVGYTIPWYARFYDMNHVLVLGRVLSGKGGLAILQEAQNLLAREFASVADAWTVNLPDEKSRRVGQAVAAASLPEVGV